MNYIKQLTKDNKIDEFENFFKRVCANRLHLDRRIITSVSNDGNTLHAKVYNSHLQTIGEFSIKEFYVQSHFSSDPKINSDLMWRIYSAFMRVNYESFADDFVEAYANTQL